MPRTRHQIFQGTFTALVTPFQSNGDLDEKALSLLISKQLEAGIEGILVLGTTGEAASLSKEEKKKVLDIARKEIPPSVFFGAGTGTSSTLEIIENLALAESAGVDFCLVQPPSYLKPSQEGIVAHFEQLLQASSLPYMIYNNPGRAAVNIEPKTLQILFTLSPRLRHLKESFGSCFSQTVEIGASLLPKFQDLKLFAGDDELILPTLAVGGVGVVSVLSNLMPKQVKAIVDACLEGNFGLARLLQEETFPYSKAAFIDSNPVPIKAMLSLKGWAEDRCRVPLFKLSQIHRQTLSQLLNSH